VTNRVDPGFATGTILGRRFKARKSITNAWLLTLVSTITVRSGTAALACPMMPASPSANVAPTSVETIIEIANAAVRPIGTAERTRGSREVAIPTLSRMAVPSARRSERKEDSQGREQQKIAHDVVRRQAGAGVTDQLRNACEWDEIEAPEPRIQDDAHWEEREVEHEKRP